MDELRRMRDNKLAQLEWLQQQNQQKQQQREAQGSNLLFDLIEADARRSQSEEAQRAYARTLMAPQNARNMINEYYRDEFYRRNSGY